MIAALATAIGLTSTPIEVTIDALAADPRRFAGATVRLSGQVDSCSSLYCAVCPTDITPRTVDRSKCLSIEFSGGQPLVRQLVRYSDVILTAKFDPTCLINPGTCTDNGTVLSSATVHAITRRRLSSEGLIWDGTTPLVRASTEVEKAVSLLLRPGDSAKAWDRLQIRVFTTADYPKYSDSVVVCWAPEGGGWPTTWEQAIFMRSSVDPWRCTTASERGGQWVLTFRSATRDLTR